MRDTIRLMVIVALLTGPLPVLAHHSFEAEFDSTKTVKLQGEVTRLDWTNPHIWIHLDAKDENGAEGQWMCEGMSTTTLGRRGWTRNTLKPGDEITVEGFRAKNGGNICNARVVTASDGTQLFAGSAPPNP